MGKLMGWTTHEVQILIDNYPLCTQREIECLLPYRTYNSIKQKAMTLKVKKAFMEEPVKKRIKTISRKIDSGIISIQGNITIHRMG